MMIQLVTPIGQFLPGYIQFNLKKPANRSGGVYNCIWKSIHVMSNDVPPNHIEAILS